MNWQEVRCNTLWSKAVRARDVFCQSCGKPDPEAAHLVDKSAGNWEVLLDIDFGVSLCPDEHRLAKDAAHMSPKTFREKILPRLLNTMDPVRAAKIQAYMNNPNKMPSRKPTNEDFKSIRIKLIEKIEGFTNDYYCDGDIQGIRRHYGQ